MTETYVIGSNAETKELELSEIKPGADWTWEFYLKDVGGSPIMTATFEMIGRDRVNGAELFEISSDNLRSISDSNGKYTQRLPASVTSLLSVRWVVWDCILTYSAEKYAPFQGVALPVRVMDAVTRV